MLNSTLKKLAAQLAMLLSGPAAWALNGPYTINPALPASATNFVSFTAAVTALNTGGVTGPVTFDVARTTFVEATGVPAITVANPSSFPIVFQEAAPLTPNDLSDNPVVQRTSGNTATTDAVLAISTADYVTFDGINVESSGVATVEFGYLVRNTATNGAKHNTIRNARIRLDRSNVNSAGVLQTSSTASGGGATATTSPGGVNESNVYENLTIENVYKGIYLLTGSTTNFGFDLGTSVRGCTIGASVATAPTGSIGNNTTTVTAGIQAVRQNELRVYNNEVQNVAVTTTGYGISIEVGYGTTEVYGNRIHDIRNTLATATTVLYGLRLDVANVGTGHQIRAYNNFIYGLTHAFTGTASATLRTIGIATNITTSTVAGTGIGVYFNTVRMQNLAGYKASSAAFSQNLVTGPVLTVRNNIFADFSPAQTGVAKHYAIVAANAARFGATGSVSNNNDLYVLNAGAAPNGFVGLSGAGDRLTLADWRTAVTQDANSVSGDPGFISATDLHVNNVVVNDAGTPAATITTVDIDGQTRSSTTPDIGADEFTPAPDDVAVLSIDAPTSPAVPGLNPVTVTIRNIGSAVLNSVTLNYVLNGALPVSQVFTGLALASGATQQLTFTNRLLALSGPNTIIVTASLPNGSADPTPFNNSQTSTFNQPSPNNDEPCNAVTLGNGPVTGSNSGASASTQNGIVLPACSPAQAPKDVWFAFTPSGTSTTLTLTGNASGMVRVFSSPDCANGPFVQETCQSSGVGNTTVGTVALTGLTPGQRYYVAVSGYGSGDTAGSFTISGTLLGSRNGAGSAELAVYPNPSTGGMLAWRVAGLNGVGQAALLNALGQVVRQQKLAGAGEQQMPTRGLAAGLYTLQVQVGGQVLSRRVVLE